MTTVPSDGSDESMVCQKCRQPLLLDPTLTSLTPAQHSLITSALPSPAGPSTLPASAKLSALPPSSREGAKIWAEAHGIPSPHRQNSVAESFILLSESTISHPPSGQTSSGLGHPGILSGANLANNLHALLSSRTSISHPLCTECTSLLQSELQKQLEELGRERDAYIAFERGITRNRDLLRKGRRPKDPDGEDDSDLGEYDIEGTDAEWEQLIRRKKELAKEEEGLIKELEQYEKELQEVKREEELVKEQEAELERQENEFLLQHSALTTRMTHLSNAHSTARTHHLLAASLLQHLESTNVYHDAFHIGHTTSTGGTIGTINGLRLGGRPSVEWEEINAAWGLVALGIDRIAAKVGCVFTTYKIVPLGSASRIEELPPGKGQYELYASSDLSPARLLQNRRFSHALVALLELLRQLFEHGREQGRPWGSGVDIHKDKIAGHSIRLPGITSGMPTLTAGMSIMGLGGSSGTGASHGSGKGASEDSTAEEGWTKACRAVLVALHKILVLESESQRSG